MASQPGNAFFFHFLFSSMHRAGFYNLEKVAFIRVHATVAKTLQVLLCCIVNYVLVVLFYSINIKGHCFILNLKYPQVFFPHADVHYTIWISKICLGYKLFCPFYAVPFSLPDKTSPSNLRPSEKQTKLPRIELII